MKTSLEQPRQGALTGDDLLDLSAYPKRHVQESASPFRYPGGKGFLTGYLASQLETLTAGDRHYAEPFCGGAGAAINLLEDGAVATIHLNDADIRVHSAWRAIVQETDRFLERLANVPLTLEEWHASRDLLISSEAGEYSFELGFATYFINRTSRAGIILGSGPIGGYRQTGRWKIDARFYRESMSRRIAWIGENRDRIRLTNEDALVFMARAKDRMPLERTLLFVDPPYVQAGSKLYLNAMSESKHSALADMLQSGGYPHWILTYDNHPLIHRLYADFTLRSIQVNYSLRSARKEREVLVQATRD
ncbi:DNA adenine methylase [Aquibium sp. A9E412]|uniref:DNA adenine methylase n=1 Tax=Aquibium sp. A9E412 TaxID=2976767 RepID=UPI0025B19AB0|nr:DNA adenine methylase [Aquibium sp. A9E412]MDN2567923.1 DNA adenine methylase [Aquibium sp. A9E412]